MTATATENNGNGVGKKEAAQSCTPASMVTMHTKLQVRNSVRNTPAVLGKQACKRSATFLQFFW